MGRGFERLGRSWSFSHSQLVRNPMSTMANNQGRMLWSMFWNSKITLMFLCLLCSVSLADTQSPSLSASTFTMLTSATAGVTSSVTMTIRDKLGSPVPSQKISAILTQHVSKMSQLQSGVNVTVDAAAPNVVTSRAIDNGDGTYAASFTPTATGNYSGVATLHTSGGLSGKYFENVFFFYSPVQTVVDPKIDFDWGQGSVIASSRDYISVRWEGRVLAGFTETYTFLVSSDDGAKLYIDGTLILDRWQSMCNDTSATVALIADSLHAIKLEYKELTGEAHVHLRWESASQSREIVPSSMLYWDSDLSGGPQNIMVYSGTTCASFSSIEGPGMATSSAVTAGVGATFKIQSRDAFGNMREQGGDTFIVQTVPAAMGTIRSEHAVTVDQSDGTYLSSLFPEHTDTTLTTALLQQGALFATYYSTVDTISPAIAAGSEIVSDPNVALAPSALPMPGVPSEFSGRWTGFVSPVGDGEFTFQTLLGTNTERVRLWLDHIVIVDQWTSLGAVGPTGTISLTPSRPVEMQLDYKAWSGGGASARSQTLKWEYGAGNLQIPTTAFYLPHGITKTVSRPFFTEPGSIAPALTQIMGTSLTLATAGISATFTISARDAFGNGISKGGETFRVSTPGLRHSLVGIVDANNGKYFVNFTATRSGSYQWNLDVGSRNILGGSSPSLIVMPGRRRMGASVVKGSGLTIATAGVASTISITVRDRHGNLQPAADWGSTASSANLAFSLGGTAVTTVTPTCPGDCPDGTNAVLRIGYVISQSGSYALSLRGTSRHDDKVAGSPFELTVVPALTCASYSTIAGSGLTLATAGGIGSFSITARDAYGNLRSTRNTPLAPFVVHTRGYSQLGTNTNTQRDIESTVSFVDTRFQSATAATKSGSASLWASLASPGALMATYYGNGAGFTENNDVFLTPVATLVRHSSALDWSTTGASGHSNVATNEFSARWRGFVRPSSATTYTFEATSKESTERMQLWIGNVALISQWTSLTATQVTGTIAFAIANAYYDISVDYAAGDDTNPVPRGLTLKWEAGVHAKSLIASQDTFVGFHVMGSPFTLTIESSNTCATTCSVAGAGLSLATVGVESTMKLTVRDAFGNLRNQNANDQQQFSFDVLRGSDMSNRMTVPWLTQGPSSEDGGIVVAAAVLEWDGTSAYTIRYNVTQPGKFNVRGKHLSSGGLWGVYYEGDRLMDHAQHIALVDAATSRAIPFSRLDPVIDFSWGGGLPVSTSELGGVVKNIGPEYFSVRWEGLVKPPIGGVWSFWVEADSATRLWVDDLKIIDDWSLTNKSTELLGTLSLLPEQSYRIKLEFRQDTGNAVARLRWSHKSHPIAVIPSSRLSSMSTFKVLSRNGLPLFVTPGSACASQSYMFGTGMTIATSGMSNTFTISVRDTYGNEPRTCGSQSSVHLRIFTASGASFVPTQLSRLPSPSWVGALTATYYSSNDFDPTNALAATCGEGSWSVEPGNANNCYRGPWSLDYSFNDFPPLVPGPAAWSARWAGQIRSQRGQKYTFVYTVGAGEDGQVIVDGTVGVAGTGRQTLVVELPKAEHLYDIEIRYKGVAAGSSNSMTLAWEHAGEEVAIPTERLVPLGGNYRVSYLPTLRGPYVIHSAVVTPTGLSATYYDDGELLKPVMARVDTTVDMDIANEIRISSGARSTGLTGLIDTQDFAVRWMGVLKPMAGSWNALPTANEFTFQVAVGTGNGERVKLWVDNSVVIDRWDTYQEVAATVFSGTINMISVWYQSDRTLYTDVRLEYKQTGGPQGKCKLQWKAQPLTDFQTIPSSNLYQTSEMATLLVPSRSGAVCVSLSTVRGQGATVGTAGAANTFTIMASDSSGMAREIGGENWQVRLHADPDLCSGCTPIVRVPALDNGDGSYDANVNVTRSGIYRLHISLATGSGLETTYYSVGDPGGTAVSTSSSPNVDFSEAGGWPGGIAGDPFSIRWLGMVRPTAAGEYTFTGVVDNTVREGWRLWVDNSRIVDAWPIAPATDVSATYSFAASNSFYDIRVEYHNTAAGNKKLDLKWTANGMSERLVPSESLFSRLDIPVSSTYYALPSVTGAGSVPSGTGLLQSSAGSAVTFTVTSRDMWSNSNLKSVQGDAFAVSLTSTNSTGHTVIARFGMTASESTAGEYLSSMSSRIAGDATLSIGVPTRGGLSGEWFSNQFLLGVPSDNSTDATINYNWANGAIAPQTRVGTPITPRDFASVRWSGYFKPPISELFTFYVESDDGARLYLDSTLVAESWDTALGGNITATVQTDATRLYEISLEYRELTGDGHIFLRYSSQSVMKQIIPSNRLYHSLIDISGSPFAHRVLAGATCGTTSRLSMLTTITTAGVAHSFTIVARDSFLNQRTEFAATDLFVVRHALSSVAPIPPIGLRRGNAVAALPTASQYSASFLATQAGDTNVYAGFAVVGGLDATYYKHTAAARACWETNTCESGGWNDVAPTIDFSRSLAPSCLASAWYSVRWAGFYQASVTVPEHTFRFTIQDNSERFRLWVDNRLLLDQWSSLSAGLTYAATTAPIIKFASTGFYDLAIDYQDLGSTVGTLPSKQQLEVKTGAGYATIPSTSLYRNFFVSTAVSVATGSTDPRQSSPPLTLLTAGAPASVTITARDAYKNERTAGGERIEVLGYIAGQTTDASRFFGTVNDLGSGKYELNYAISQSGAYTLVVNNNGVQSSQSLTVIKGPASAAVSTVHGNAISLCTAGVAATFTVKIRDAASNIHVANPASDEWLTEVAVRLSSQDSSEQHNGRLETDGVDYKASFRTTKSGTFTTSVLVAPKGSPGLRGVYYNYDPDRVSGVSAVVDRPDADISFSWGSQALPSQTMTALDGFLVRWTGFVKSVQPSEYTFQINLGGNDDRVKLWLDDHWVINQWTSLSSASPSGTLALLANNLYDIAVNYRDDSDEAACVLKWSYTGQTSTLVPSSRLFPQALHVSGSPFSLTAQPHSVCGTASSVSGIAVSLATAGVSSMFTIQARDWLGNPRTTNSETFVVQMRGPPTGTVRDVLGTVSSLSTSDGRYAVAYTPYRKYNGIGDNDTPWMQLLTRMAEPSGSIFATYYGGQLSTGADLAATYTIAEDLDWSAPATSYPTSPGDFSIRWAGFLMPRYAGEYTFTTTAFSACNCERIRLFIDNVAVIDQWTSLAAAPAVSSTFQILTANAFHDLRLDYFRTGGSATGLSMKTEWQSASQGFEIVATTSLYQAHPVSAVTATTVAGLSATYYTSATMATPGKRAIDSTVDWSGNWPHNPCITSGDFGVRWLGLVRPSRADLYTFHAELLGSGERVKLIVDDVSVISEWSSLSSTAPSGTIVFPTAGALYNIEMHYKSTDTVPTARKFSLLWECGGEFRGAWPGSDVTPGNTVSKAIIPSSRLSSRMTFLQIDRDDSSYWFPGAWPCPGTLGTLNCRGIGSRAPSDLNVRVKSGKVCSTTSRAYGDGITVGTAGASTTFELQLRDEFSNRLDHLPALHGAGKLSDGTRVESTFSLVTPTYTTDVRDPFAVQVTYTTTRSGVYQYDVGHTHRNGLFGTYFSTNNFAGRMATRVDAVVSFDWGYGAPVLSEPIGANNFSARWTGLFHPQTSDTHTFWLRADDSARLYMNGAVVINGWSTSGNNEFSGTMNLVSSRSVEVLLEYREMEGSAAIEWSFSTSTSTKQTVPASQLTLPATSLSRFPSTLHLNGGSVCGTRSTFLLASQCIVTAGVSTTFTLQARDEWGNNRGDSSGVGVSYESYVRLVQDSRAPHTTRPSCPTTGCGTGGIQGVTAAGGLGLGQFTAVLIPTTAGTHSLLGSLVTGALPSGAYGLSATYFNEIHVTDQAPAFSRIDATVDWSGSNPAAPGSLADDAVFGVRWAGLFKSPVTASEFTFQTLLHGIDERSRVSVDNTVLIDQWTTVAATDTTATYGPFRSGQFYDITVDYGSPTGTSHAQISLRWSHSGMGLSVVPSTVLYQSHTATSRVLVVPGATCATHSKWSGGALTLMTAGVRARLTLTARDAYSNSRSVGGDTFVTRMFAQTGGAPHNPSIDFGRSCWNCPPTVHVEAKDLNNGTYLINFVPTKGFAVYAMASVPIQGGVSATYWDDHTTDTSVPGAPGAAAVTVDAMGLDFSYNIGTKPTGLNNNLFSSRWVGFVRPSKRTEFTFMVQNEFSDRTRVWIDNSLIVDQWTSMAATLITATYGGFTEVNGLYDISISYKASRVDSRMTLKWENTDTGVVSLDVSQGVIRTDRLYQRIDVPQTAKYDATTSTLITGGGVCGSKVIAYGSGLTLMTAGITATVTVQSRDAFNNLRAVNNDDTPELTVPDGPVNKIVALNPIPLDAMGQFTGLMAQTVAGTYEVYTGFKAVTSNISPFTLTVVPGAVCATKSVTTGLGTTQVSQTSSSTMTLIAKDMYDNPINSDVAGAINGNTFVARVYRMTAGHSPFWPERYNFGGNTGETRKEATIHARRSLVPTQNNGAYSWKFTRDKTSDAHFLHVSLGSVGGLYATYYAKGGTGVWNLEADAASRVSLRTHDTVDFSDTATLSTFFGADRAACLGGNGGTWAVRWAGLLRPPSSTSEFTFETALAPNLNERARLWVDNTLLLNQWTSLSNSPSMSATYRFRNANELYDVWLEYSVEPTAAFTRTMQLKWACCGDTLAIVPSTRLFIREDVANSPWGPLTLQE